MTNVHYDEKIKKHELFIITVLFSLKNRQLFLTQPLEIIIP